MAEPLGISTPVTPVGGIDHRLYPGTPVTPAGPRNDGPPNAPPEAAPSTEFHLGTTVEAFVRASANTPGALPVGTQLLLRIVAVPSFAATDLLIGRVIESSGPETLVDTGLGLLALQRRLALAPETVIAFERLEEILPALATRDTPLRAGGWASLDEVLAVLTQIAPELAAHLRAELMPGSPSQLAGTLLFLLGALYQGDWPGAAVSAALAASGHAKLSQRLSDDAAELRRLAADPSTGDWRVLTLPLLIGMTVQPLRLFMRRRKPGSPAEDVTRFAIEVELSMLGPVQLDGMLRGTHLVLVLRSHRSLPDALRKLASDVCHRALEDWGLTGEFGFMTEQKFALAPLSNLRKHVAVMI